MIGKDRLDPQPWRADYIQLRCLRAQLQKHIRARWETGAAVSVLDVGCGAKPYEPLFAPYRGEYIGMDTVTARTVDVVGRAESIPLEDQRVDCVICTQVLQYVERPDVAVREMRRVLRRGGLLLLSTHGVSFVDRAGPDRWRWTQHGLRTLLATEGGWEVVQIDPAGGVMCAAAYLIGGQFEAGMHHLGGAWVAAPVCLGLNAVAWRMDRAVHRRFPELSPEASVNYLAAALAGNSALRRTHWSTRHKETQSG